MKSFKLKFNRNKQQKRFKSFIEKVKKQDQWKEDAAELAITNIKIETRKQKFIQDGSKQPTLAKSTIEQRKELSKYNDKGVGFGPSKSNLTLSGQLIESLERKKDRKRVIIEPTGKRTPYNTKGGRVKAKHTPTNKDLAKYLAEKGRKFIGFNDKVKKAVKKKFLEHLRRNLKDYNKR